MEPKNRHSSAKFRPPQRVEHETVVPAASKGRLTAKLLSMRQFEDARRLDAVAKAAVISQCLPTILGVFPVRTAHGR